jgi:quercetin dioxygenase-like cupin family protein
MTDTPPETGSFLPPDDLTRHLTVTDPDGPGAQHIAVVGDTYTILLSGDDTGGRFAMIDMLIPSGSGPPPHRHDFDETFQVVEGEVVVTFRDETFTVSIRQTANIPSNAPHHFRNETNETVLLLCVVSPSGLEEFFAAVGDPVAARTSPPPELSSDEKKTRMQKSIELAPKYHQEVLIPH